MQQNFDGHEKNGSSHTKIIQGKAKNFNSQTFQNKTIMKYKVPKAANSRKVLGILRLKS
ncbi:MAG: hypothetical protein LBV41_12640 [Cytophagaceae bacterium]|nr:hypothetical protein [Cytophagaceae bacterium]